MELFLPPTSVQNTTFLLNGVNDPLSSNTNTNLTNTIIRSQTTPAPTHHRPFNRIASFANKNNLDIYAIDFRPPSVEFIRNHFAPFPRSNGSVPSSILSTDAGNVSQRQVTAPHSLKISQQQQQQSRNNRRFQPFAKVNRPAANTPRSLQGCRGGRSGTWRWRIGKSVMAMILLMGMWEIIWS